VLIPEVNVHLEGETGLLRLLERRLARDSHAVIVVAEGAGQDLCEGNGRPCLQGRQRQRALERQSAPCCVTDHRTL